MRIVHHQLRTPERVFFASAQALACGGALYLGWVVAEVLHLDATTPGGLNGPGLDLVFSLLLAFSLVAAVATAFLCWTFARGARIGATAREAMFFRVLVGLAIVGSLAASLALRFFARL